MKKIIVVIPTYNEVENIQELINRVLRQDEKIEVLVADSHSSDGTEELVKKLAQKNKRVYYLDVGKRGLGLGLSKGFEFAVDRLKADILIQIDGDLSHNPDDIPALLKKIEEGNDLVLGSRQIKGGANRLPFHRRLFSLGASLAGRFLMGIRKIHEFTASYRAFTKETYRKLRKSKKLSGRIDWTYLLVFLGEAAKLPKIKIAETPIVFTDRERGKSKMNTPRFIFSFLTYAILYRLEKSQRFFKYALIGLASTIINWGAGEFFSKIKLHPSLAYGLGAEFSIIWNFTLNNFWTFADARISGKVKILKKFIAFNLTSAGAIFIQIVVVGAATFLFGNTSLVRTMAFVFAIAFLIIPYNYFIYKKVIWRVKK